MLSGLLRGMGREAECTVSTVKVSLPGTNHYEYTKLGIHNEPAELPDGPYAVTIEGRTVPVQRHLGAWISRTLP
jgi:hypothetical protein